MGAVTTYDPSKAEANSSKSKSKSKNKNLRAETNEERVNRLNQAGLAAEKEGKSFQEGVATQVQSEKGKSVRRDVSTGFTYAIDSEGTFETVGRPSPAEAERQRQLDITRRLNRGEVLQPRDILQRGGSDITAGSTAANMTQASLQNLQRQEEAQARLQAARDKLRQETEANLEAQSQPVEQQIPEDEINPTTGQPYNTLTVDNPTLDQKVSRYLTSLEESQSMTKRAIGGYLDFAYGFGSAIKDSVVGTYDLIMHPVKTTKNIWNTATNADARNELLSDLQDTVNKKPTYALGYMWGSVFSIKKSPKATKLGVTAGENVLKAQTKIAVKVAKGIDKLPESKLGRTVSKGAETLGEYNKRLGKKAAVFRNGERVSPISNAQKSKIARQQAYNPNIIARGNSITEKIGKARASRRTVEFLDKERVRATQKIKGARSDAGRTVIRSSVERNIQTGKISNEQYALTSEKYGAKTPKKNQYTRPASQVKTNRKLDYDVVAVDKNKQQLLLTKESLLGKEINFGKRQPRYKQTPNNNLPVTKDLENALLKQVGKSEPGPLGQIKLSPREARFKEKLKVLRKIGKARARKLLESKQAPFDIKANVYNFFEEAAPKQSRALVLKANKSNVAVTKNFKGQVSKINPARVPATRSMRELAQYGRGRRITPDVEIIEPKRKFAPTSTVPKTIKGVKPTVRTVVSTGLGSTNLRKQKVQVAIKQTSIKKQNIIINPNTKPRQVTGLNRKIVPKQIVNFKSTGKAIIPKPVVNNPRSTKRGSSRRPTPSIPETKIPAFVPRVANKPRKPTQPKIPKQRIFIPRASNRQTEKRVRGYDVLVKRFGKFFKVNAGALPLGAAVSLGDKVVRNTAAAQFKTVRSNKFVRNIKSGTINYSNYYKSKSGSYIEKRNKRIKTLGEKIQITYKGIRSRRGIFA